jgi:hypothetical protein
VVERLGLLVTLRRVLPDRIVGLVEEEGGVAGIFRIDVDFAGGDRLAHDRGRAERHLVGHRQAVRLQHLKDDIAKEIALGVNLRGDDDRVGKRRRRRADGQSESDNQ